MPDPRVINLARTLVHYSTAIAPKDHVAIYGEHEAAPLIKAVYQEVLKAGGYPYLFMRLGGLDRIFFEEASKDQLEHVYRTDQMVRAEFEALIGIQSQSNTRSLSNVDPAKQSLRHKAYAPLMETFLQRGASQELKWCGTLYPTNAYAQDAEMSLEEFEDYVYSTTFSDEDDPIGKWQEVHSKQQQVIDWLSDKDRIEVKGPNVEMSLSVKERVFWNSDGKRNMPSGEIFTGPVEDSVNGWVRFTYPAIEEGREVDGIQLHFENGKVIKATAEKNEAYLLAMLDTDPGARYLGEWAIGTNNKIDRFIKNILFDEKIGGTIHMAVGAGYPETGSKNKSAIHWDMICDMRDGGQISADGEVFYESGEFRL
jgi:aminopeptidase